jgi:hypothetical protein
MRGLITALVLIVTCTAASAGVFDNFVDPKDGKFDLSDSLLSRHGFLPVPIIITEPAVGFGFGLSLAFFHSATDAPAGGEDARTAPPSISAIAGAYTESGTWFAGGGHFGSWKDDSLRYTGGLGYADASLDFYVRDRPIGYELRGVFLLQEVKFRIGESDFFLGAEYIYFGSNSSLRFDFDVPGIEPRDIESDNAGLAAVGYYDHRDNILSPTRGQELKLTAMRHDNIFGGDFEYWELELRAEFYNPVSDHWFVNVKADVETTDGDVPFYGLPFIHLRGIPALRFQGDTAASLETEVRWQLDPRWSLLGFVGVGATDSDIKLIGSDGAVWAGGAGFRYLLARKLGLRGGIDIARGAGDWAFYIQTGHAWGR